jgi:pilus assembly protein Flp/PilA
MPAITQRQQARLEDAELGVLALEGPMKRWISKVSQFLVSEDGPTAVEYAVMLALIVVVCLAAIGSIGTNANTTFTTIANSLSSGS